LEKDSNLRNPISSGSVSQEVKSDLLGTVLTRRGPTQNRAHETRSGENYWALGASAGAAFFTGALWLEATDLPSEQPPSLQQESLDFGAEAHAASNKERARVKNFCFIEEEDRRQFSAG